MMKLQEQFVLPLTLIVQLGTRYVYIMAASSTHGICTRSCHVPFPPDFSSCEPWQQDLLVIVGCVVCVMNLRLASN